VSRLFHQNVEHDSSNFHTPQPNRTVRRTLDNNTETMNQEQVNQLVGMIQAIDGKIDAFKDEVRNRFDDLEQRMTNVEGAAARIAGPAFPGAPPRASSSGVPNSGYGDNPLPRREAYISHQPARGPPDQRGGWSSKSTGSKENATYLPYAIEHIAKKYQQRAAGDKRHW
jgi:hypothetical protein